MYSPVDWPLLDRCAVFGITVQLTFLFDKLVEKARLAHTGIANHQKLEEVICTKLIKQTQMTQPQLVQ